MKKKDKKLKTNNSNIKPRKEGKSEGKTRYTTPYEFNFKEDDFMTCYYGHWIRKRRVESVNTLYQQLHAKVDGNKELKSDLEKEEKLDQLMKKVYRKEHSLLKVELTRRMSKAKRLRRLEKSKKHLGNTDSGKKKLTIPAKTIEKEKKLDQPMDKFNQKEHHWQGMESSQRTYKFESRKKPGRYLGIDYQEDPDIVKYEGFCIHKSSVDHLNKIKDELAQKGLSKEDYKKALRSECRKAERQMKKDKKLSTGSPVEPVRRTFGSCNMQASRGLQKSLGTFEAQNQESSRPARKPTYQEVKMGIPAVDVKPATHITFDD